MQFVTHSPSRDPIQTLQPQFIPNYRRAYFDRIPRTTRSDSISRLNGSRKRSRIEVKEDSYKPFSNQSFFHEKCHVNNIEMNFTECEASKAADYCGSLIDGQLQQEQVEPLKLANSRGSLLPLSYGSGLQTSRPTTDSLSDSIHEIPRKAARVNSKFFGDKTKSPFDEFSRRLGVGWSSVLDSDPDVQAAVRGWANYIENHFPISNVNIRLRSRGLGCFLVEASEGYYLFGEDLKQGKLVSTDLETVWTNLRGPAPVFEGKTFIRAVDRSTIFPQKQSSNSASSLMINNFNTNHAHQPSFQNQRISLSDTNLLTKMDIS